MTQTILLIGEDGSKIGNVSFSEAEEIASNQGKDLILVNSNNNVYKIGDSGKIKYDQKRKERKLRAQKRAQKIKEIQLRPTTDNNDLETKLKHVREFLSDGLKTKLVMKFKRQQMSYRDDGMNRMAVIVKRFVDEGLAVAERPQFEGPNIVVFLAPHK